MPIRIGSSFQKEREPPGRTAAAPGPSPPSPGSPSGAPSALSFPGGHGAVRYGNVRFHGVPAVFLAVVSRPCANRHIPHANSPSCAAACPIHDAGPPLP